VFFFDEEMRAISGMKKVPEKTMKRQRRLEQKLKSKSDK
jgi:hypothetical protein